jgi:hypothetical protein
VGFYQVEPRHHSQPNGYYGCVDQGAQASLLHAGADEQCESGRHGDPAPESRNIRQRREGALNARHDLIAGPHCVPDDEHHRSGEGRVPGQGEDRPVEAYAEQDSCGGAGAEHGVSYAADGPGRQQRADDQGHKPQGQADRPGVVVCARYAFGRARLEHGFCYLSGQVILLPLLSAQTGIYLNGRRLRCFRSRLRRRVRALRPPGEHGPDAGLARHSDYRVTCSVPTTYAM